MTASRSARERKASVEAGPLATVRIDLDGTRQFVYKISCTECVARGKLNWSAYRPGADNGFMAAMDRWIFHLIEKHPQAEAPCLAFVPEAQQRLHERREREGSDPANGSAEGLPTERSASVGDDDRRLGSGGVE
jgi:hypothetical protein